MVKHDWVSLIVALMSVTFAWTGQSREAAVEVQNESVHVAVEAEHGIVICRKSSEKKTFAEGTLASGRCSSVQSVVWTIEGVGEAKAIELRSETGRVRVGVVPGLPFVFMQAGITNTASAKKQIDRLELIDFQILPETPMKKLRVLGTGGLTTVETAALTRRRAKTPTLPPSTKEAPSGSYMFMAVAEPETRHGVVSGWISSDRGSGIVFSYPEEGKTHLRARVDYGRLILPPQAETLSEIFVIGVFDDARIGLEQYADMVAKYYQIRLPPQISGYCTWYSRPNGGACDAENIIKVAETAKEKLVPYGFNFIQIDDKWQVGVYSNGPRMVFSKFREDGPYPKGMKATAEKLKAVGLTPGLWWIPFGGKHFDPFFADKQELFVKNEDGTPRAVKWGGTVLDLTSPAALDYVASNARLLASEWGYDYFKLDGLWVGTGTEDQYGNNEYEGNDRLGYGIVHDPAITPIEAYRKGLATVRKAAGKPMFFLGCNISQNMRSFGASFGLLDAMRIGPDNKKAWGPLMVGPWSGSNRYFLNGRVWYNDPDPIYVSNEMPLNHAQVICSWVAVAGAFNVCSDWLPGLEPERMHLLQRTLPSHGLQARPADLFEQEFPRIWVLPDTNSDRVVVGLFNLAEGWKEQKDISIQYALEKLGLDASKSYDTYEYWTGEATTVQGRLDINVPKECCRILSVRPKKNHPHVISTSRHITQGIIDLRSEVWHEANRTLEGESSVVAGDPYELRVIVPTGFQATDALCGDKPMKVVQQGHLLRVSFTPSSSETVRWKVSFNK